MAANIGAVARAMGNFGLSDLRLVTPRDGWPQAGAAEMATHSADIIEQACVFPSLSAALHGCQISFATTARHRSLNKQVLSAHEVARQTHASEVKTAYIFGPENSGLNNDEIALATACVSITAAAGKASLNLGQAAGIMAYEWFQGQQTVALSALEAPAPQEELQHMFVQLEHYLDTIHYWREANKKIHMWRNIQNIFSRNQLTSQEVRSLRGLLRGLWERSSDH